MKFGGKQTMRDKMAMAEKRLARTTGASKGGKPAPAAKVKPILKKGTVGIKVTKKF